MLSENWLSTLQRTIRQFVVLPEEEPIDQVMLAAFLVNHTPKRDVNVWMVLVAPQGEAKTELVNLLIDHPSVWKLPDRLKRGYFISSMTEERSALFRLEAERKRILVMSDMGALSSVPYNEQDDIAGQFRSVHDGHFVYETGLKSRKLEWGPKAAADLLGFIGTATEDFYRFNTRMWAIGSRFLLYFYDPLRYRHWTDTSDLREIQRRQPNKAAARAEAKELLQSSLNSALAQLEEFEEVDWPEDAVVRIAEASRLVGRALGAGEIQNSGNRHAIRIRDMVRMFAFMRGSAEVDDNDIRLGLKIVFSQMPPSYARALAFILERNNRAIEWQSGTLISAVSGTRRVYDPVIAQLVDGSILEKIGERGKDVRYRLHDEVLSMARTFDADGNLFHPMPRPPRLVRSQG